MLYFLKSVNVFILAAFNLVRFQFVFCGLVVSMSVQFSKLLQYYSDLSGVCVCERERENGREREGGRPSGQNGI